MKFQTIEEVKNSGFEGFVPIEQLRPDKSAIPSGAGVYLVVRETNTALRFLSEGTGGYFKKKKSECKYRRVASKLGRRQLCALYWQSEIVAKPIKAIYQIWRRSISRALGRSVYLAVERRRPVASMLERDL